MTVVALLLGVGLLGETLTTGATAGLILIGLGAWLATGHPTPGCARTRAQRTANRPLRTRGGSSAARRGNEETDRPRVRLRGCYRQRALRATVGRHDGARHRGPDRRAGQPDEARRAVRAPSLGARQPAPGRGAALLRRARDLP